MPDIYDTSLAFAMLLGLSPGEPRQRESRFAAIQIVLYRLVLRTGCLARATPKRARRTGVVAEQHDDCNRYQSKCNDPLFLGQETYSEPQNPKAEMIVYGMVQDLERR